jgi:hypothetical protein
VLVGAGTSVLLNEILVVGWHFSCYVDAILGLSASYENIDSLSLRRGC